MYAQRPNLCLFSNQLSASDHVTCHRFSLMCAMQRNRPRSSWLFDQVFQGLQSAAGRTRPATCGPVRMTFYTRVRITKAEADQLCRSAAGRRGR